VSRSGLATLPALLALGASAWAADMRVSAGTSARLEQVGAQLRNASENLALVETQYAGRGDPSPQAALERRFSDGEIQYLLGDWATASVLFYDLVSDRSFESSPRRPDALFYLAESLYQQGNLASARLYLRQLLTLDSSHYKEALSRYLDVTARLHDWGDLEPYLARARGPDGKLPPEVAYVYAKWLLRRGDLPAEQRRQRAEEAFGQLTGEGNPLRLASLYFLGVLRVRAQDWSGAAQRFAQVTAAKPADERDQRIIELAQLSLGRVLVEQGKYNEATDRYQNIREDSPNFPEALYEMAWAKVRAEDWEGAHNATDILLLVAPDSPLAPEAQILQGNLLLKLKRYNEATDTYQGVITTYAPVRDEIDGLLAVHKDPVTYFDNLIARNENSLDVNTLLPPLAVKWASTQEDVTEAMRVVKALEAGRKGVGDGQLIAERIVRTLDERGAEAFPGLQEGMVRAEAVANQLASAEASLNDAETEALDPLFNAEERRELGSIAADQAAARTKLAKLPTTGQDISSRRQRMQARVDAVDKEAFRLGYELQSMNAMLVATEKWVVDSRRDRRNTPEDERFFQEKMASEQRAIRALEEQVQQLRGEVQSQRGLVDTTVSGEEILRAELSAASARTAGILAGVEPRASGEAGQFVARAHDLRSQISTLRQRDASAQSALRERVKRKGEEVREKVVVEQKLLAGYGKDEVVVSGDARQLVGRMAYDSFRRVRHQFYDLVLKADVGVVDTAFTRKQAQTTGIQKVASQKDEELRALDEEFRPILKDVD
jgi:TolA-binding protein